MIDEYRFHPDQYPGAGPDDLAQAQLSDAELRELEELTRRIARFAPPAPDQRFVEHLARRLVFTSP